MLSPGSRQKPLPPPTLPSAGSAGSAGSGRSGGSGDTWRFAVEATSLRWMMGLFCSFIGAFMLVAPQQFDSAIYASMRPFREVWAIAALCSGVGLVAVTVLRSRRPERLAAHGAVSVVLLVLAGARALAGSWNGTVLYGLLGIAMLAAIARPRRTPAIAAQRARPELPARPENPELRELPSAIVPMVAPRPDLLALAAGAIATLVGSHMLASSADPHNPFGGHPRQVLAVGLALVLTGPLLCWVQLRPPARRWLWAAHLAAGAALFVAGAGWSGASPPWTGIAFYWGVGGVVALQPGLRLWLAAVDTASLRTRLALALAAATSLSLVFAAAISTAQEERLVSGQASETLAVEARAVAQNVRDYVELNGARATAVAALAGRLPLAAEAQRRLLESSLPGYRDVAGMVLIDPGGRPVASDGGAAIGPGTLAALAAAVRPREIPVKLALDSLSARPLLLLAAPVVTPDDRIVAAVVMAFDSRSLERRIARDGAIVTLADGGGNLIARSNGATYSSRLPPGWDRAAAAGAPPQIADRLVACAAVAGFQWRVAIERSRAAAFAGVNRGRDLAFALLLMVVPLAIGAGILTSRRITRPLAALADAVGELTAGNLWAPLETSDISEVERLSAAFREMRDRLAQRTAESEGLARELRARAEALGETDRRKDEFLAMLAHELRNPLGAITSAAYILGQARAVEPPAARSIAAIQRQTQHLARLVDDLLDVSRITRGKVELRRGALDLGEVVRQAVETTRPLIEARHHRLEVSLPDAPLPVLADPTRIEQVLANLIRNAVKFTEPHGLIEVTAAAADGLALVRVRDSGVGIAGDLLPRVFDLFTQGDQGLDRSAGGLGIGLTLVRSLVEMHGGRVEAHSRGTGFGSEFVIWLPLDAGSRELERRAAL
jgi:signal transduction histidine kinase